MKHLLYAGVLLLSLSACHKSLEDRAAQECKEYTEKKCPTPVVNDTRMDSMVFEPSARTIHYYYSLVGNADNEQAVNAKKSELRKALRDALRADTGTKGIRMLASTSDILIVQANLLQRCYWMSNTLKRTIKS